MSESEDRAPDEGIVDIELEKARYITETYASAASLGSFLTDIGENDLAAKFLDMKDELSGLL